MKATPYDNSGIFEDYIAEGFQRQFGKKDHNTIKPALKELVKEGKITKEQKDDLLLSFSVSPNPK